MRSSIQRRSEDDDAKVSYSRVGEAYYSTRGRQCVRLAQERVQRCRDDGADVVYRERRYFILATDTPCDGTAYEIIRWRQEGDVARRVLLTLPQTKVAETYYSPCAEID